MHSSDVSNRVNRAVASHGPLIVSTDEAPDAGGAGTSDRPITQEE
jgi:hypothetical protein